MGLRVGGEERQDCAAVIMGALVTRIPYTLDIPMMLPFVYTGCSYITSDNMYTAEEEREREPGQIYYLSHYGARCISGDRVVVHSDFLRGPSLHSHANRELYYTLYVKVSPPAPELNTVSRLYSCPTGNKTLNSNPHFSPLLL